MILRGEGPISLRGDYMSILSWNVRDFNDPFKFLEVRNLIKSHGIKVLCLLETRVKESRHVQIRNKLGKS